MLIAGKPLAVPGLVRWIGLAALVGIGIMIGERTGRPVPELITAAPSVQQADGSIIAERRPDPAPPTAPHKIPKGAKEERRVSITVQPRPVPPTVTESGPVCDCPPVRVDLSLVQQDGGRRVIASSPDGEIVGAIDVPIEPALVMPEPRRWAAGLSYDLQAKAPGVWIERDLARVRVGVDLIARKSGVAATVRVGWVF
jgi:hypothetical protein